MDELRNALNAAVAEPPPTGIDLDRLIEHTRRRTRTQYRLGVAAGVFAVVAGAAVLPYLPARHTGNGAGGSGPPSAAPCVQLDPTTTARPDRGTEPALPTEPCGVTETRLLEALIGGLDAALPGWSTVSADDPHQPVAFRRQAPDAAPDGYLASVQLARGMEYHVLIVDVTAHAPIQPDLVCKQADLATATCTQLAGGEVLAVLPDPTLAGSSDGQIGGYEVHDVRPDGTTVVVQGNQALTLDTLTRIARTPGLSLFG